MLRTGILIEHSTEKAHNNRKTNFVCEQKQPFKNLKEEKSEIPKIEHSLRE